MDEEGWLTTWDCRAMYKQCTQLIADNRRCRLFAVASSRLLTKMFFDERLERTLALAEVAADDDCAEALLNLIGSSRGNPFQPFEPMTGWEKAVADTVAAIHSLDRLIYSGGAMGGRLYHENWKHMVIAAVALLIADDPTAEKGREIRIGTPYGFEPHDCTHLSMYCVEIAYLLHDRDVEACYGEEVEPEIRRPMADLLRDIFGNPFRPVAFDPAWRTEATLGLAGKMYDDRDFRAMPILADALEEAGCENADILSHCRESGVHVRGCWVVDLVLGK